MTPEGTITVYKCMKGLDIGARRWGKEQFGSVDEGFYQRQCNKVEQSRLWWPGRENTPLPGCEDSLASF